MKSRPLWPLIPPVVVLGMMFLFITLTHWISGMGGMNETMSECGVLKLTGLHCPGCGGTRCAQSILSLHWADAMGYNPMLMTGFLVFIGGSAYLIIRMTILAKPAPKMPDIRPRWIGFGIGALMLFTILRNIPAYPFTLLAP